MGRPVSVGMVLSIVLSAAGWLPWLLLAEQSVTGVLVPSSPVHRGRWTTMTHALATEAWHTSTAMTPLVVGLLTDDDVMPRSLHSLSFE